VFNVKSGKIISARSFSAGGYRNYENFIRSMIVSSGFSPKAYFLSNYRTGASSLLCTGQLLLKFDPLTFSSVPVWTK
jgi:hypothetical protein